jgi:hypothetical protein
MNGTEENNSIREMFRQAMPDDLPAVVEQRLEKRLTAFRERIDATTATSGPLKPARPWNQIAHWMGGLTMRQRIALGGVGAAAMLAIALVWMGAITKPVSAMEKMAESVRKTKSYKCIFTGEEPSPSPEVGKPPITVVSQATQYWLAPGSLRSEVTTTSPASFEEPNPAETLIYPLGKSGIHIFHGTKRFLRYPPTAEGASWELYDLGKFSGEADRDLGTRRINGKEAHGFQIDIRKLIEPDAIADSRVHGTAEIWVDPRSNLPVLFRRCEHYPGIDKPIIMQISDIQWNIDLDPKLFDPTPPRDYTDATPKPPASEEQIHPITEALRIYAKASGWHYPRETHVNRHNAGYELCKLLGVDASWPDKWPTNEAGGRAAKAAKAFDGFDKINEIQLHNPNAAYYGKTIGPNDKDKVLLRWELDDGRYVVVFGDLRNETVTAERLHDLEGK